MIKELWYLIKALFNPADNLSEGKNTNFVADGYKSIEVKEGVWEIVKG